MHQTEGEGKRERYLDRECGGWWKERGKWDEPDGGVTQFPHFNILGDKASGSWYFVPTKLSNLTTCLPFQKRLTKATQDLIINKMPVPAYISKKLKEEGFDWGGQKKSKNWSETMLNLSWWNRKMKGYYCLCRPAEVMIESGKGLGFCQQDIIKHKAVTRINRDVCIFSGCCHPEKPTANGYAVIVLFYTPTPLCFISVLPCQIKL